MSASLTKQGRVPARKALTLGSPGRSARAAHSDLGDASVFVVTEDTEKMSLKAQD
jgi:hypothetical protein